MITVPPFDAPGDHVIAIVVAVVTAALFARLIGASGTVKITAPLPSFELIDGPTALIAVILMKMLLPQGKLKGAASRVVIGVIQYSAEIA